jgi:hypothetical protein
MKTTLKRVRSVSDLDTDAITIGHEIISARSKKKKAKAVVSSGVSAVVVQPTTSSCQPVLPVDTIDEAIDSVLSQSKISSDEDVCVADLRLSISNLSAIVQQQQDTINSLATQLNFVLSFLGIKNVNESIVESNDVGVSSGANKLPSLSSVPLSSTSYAAVSSRGVSAQQPFKRPLSVKEVILSTVYNEKVANDRRSNSMIVSGLVCDPDHSDMEVIDNLCYSEFGIRSAVTSTKRLGNVIDGRIQPVLVVVKSADTAKEIILCAKSLRRSPDPAIRDHVYINANLSKAEARAAYDQRCRRRLAARPTQQLNLDSADTASNINSDPKVSNTNQRVILNSQFHRQKSVLNSSRDADHEDGRPIQQHQ